MQVNKQIERRIVLGMIVSDDYLKELHRFYQPQLIQSGVAKRLAKWCMDHYEKYQKAPGKDIEGIYLQKLKEGLPKEIAEEIEEDILPDLSEEYDRTKFNVPYLIDQSRSYFKERALARHVETINGLIEAGELEEAHTLASTFRSEIPEAGRHELELNSAEADTRIRNAFSQAVVPLVKYKGALGSIWNGQLIRGGFVGFLAPEKRGKTFLLTEIALRAVRQGNNVAFFQAGDMTEEQMLRRISVALAKKSDKMRYCRKTYVPVLDCLYNQIDECDEDCREGTSAPFAGSTDHKVQAMKIDALHEATMNNPEHITCHNCDKIYGTFWLRQLPDVSPLEPEEAVAARHRYFSRKGAGAGRGRMLVSTHASGTLTVTDIQKIMKDWEAKSNFVPDVVLIDYADLLEMDGKVEFRHKQNEIWKGLRRISQERHCLVVTATQADANSYDKNTLQLQNFSEDKRKYAHVTAMYGLNQDKEGVEKKLGILRINELVIRDDETDYARCVAILQCLQRGQAYVGSFHYRKAEKPKS